MKTDFSIQLLGLGHCSSLGLGINTLREASPPLPTEELVPTKQGLVPVPVLKTPEFNLSELVPEALERRMSRLSKMCFYAAEEALQDSNLLKSGFAPERIGLIVGTAFGNLEQANLYQKRIILQGPMGVSPNLFTSSIPSSLASSLSIVFQIQGATSTVTTTDQTVQGSFNLAYHWLKQGTVDQVLVVIGDEISDYHLYFEAHQKKPQPLTEGAVAFVLSRTSTDFASNSNSNSNSVPAIISNRYSAFKINPPFTKQELPLELSFLENLVTQDAFVMAFNALTIR